MANSRENTVSIIDGSANEVIANITVGQQTCFSRCRSAAEIGLDSLIFVANADSNTVSVIDATNNKVIDDITAGGSGRVYGS